MRALFLIVAFSYMQLVTSYSSSSSIQTQTSESQNTIENQPSYSMEERKLGKFSKSVSLDDLQNVLLLVQDPTTWKGEYKMFKLLSDNAKGSLRTIEFGTLSQDVTLKELVEELRPCISVEFLSISTESITNSLEDGTNPSLVFLPALKQVYIRKFYWYMYDWNEIIFFTKNEGGVFPPDSVAKRLLAPGLKVTMDLGFAKKGKIQTHLFNFDNGQVINPAGPLFPLDDGLGARIFAGNCRCESNLSSDNTNAHAHAHALPNLTIIHLGNVDPGYENGATFEYNEILKCNPQLTEFKVFPDPSCGLSCHTLANYIEAWVDLSEIWSDHLTIMSLDGVLIYFSKNESNPTFVPTVSITSLYLINCVLTVDVVNNFGEIFHNLVYLYVDFTPRKADISQEFNCHDLIYNTILKPRTEQEQIQNQVGWIFIQTCARDPTYFEIPRVHYLETEKFLHELGIFNNTQTFLLKKEPEGWSGQVFDNETISLIRNKFQEQTLIHQ